MRSSSKTPRAARTAMDDISVIEFSQFQFQGVKLD